MQRTTLNVRDANLIKTKALPAAAGSTVTDAIDTGLRSGRAVFESNCELLITAPALTATQLPDDKTATYIIESSDTSAFSAITTLVSSAIAQVGDTGADGATYRYKLPSDCLRYVRVKVTTGTGAGNCSAASVKMELLV